MSRPTFLRFHLENNEDEEITCFFCSVSKCEQFFEVLGNERRWVGCHTSCAEKHMNRLTKTNNSE